MSRSTRWVAFVERWHRSLLAGFLVLTLASGLSLFALRFDLDVLEMLPHGEPAFDNFKTFVADFGELDELLVLIEGKQAEELESFADQLVERVRALDSVARVQGRFYSEPIQRDLLGTYLYGYVPRELYAEIKAQLTAEGIDAQVSGNRAALSAPLDLMAAQWIRRDPLGIARRTAAALAAALPESNFRIGGGYISSRDDQAILVLIRPHQNAFDIEFSNRLMAEVRGIEAQTRAADPSAFRDIVVGYTGSYAFAVEDAASIKGDIGTYTVLSLLAVLAVFVAGYRNLRILPFVTLPLVSSTLVTFAGSLLVYAQLNAVSICFAALLYGLSMDSAVHYYTHLLQERRHASLSEAVARTLSRLGSANAVASATTAASFAVIGFSQLKGISQLGSLTGLGMLVTMVQFFVLYPALSFAMPASCFEARSLATPRLGAIAAACARHAVAVRVGFLAVGIFVSWAALGVGLDVDLTHLRPEGTSAARVQDRMAELFGSDVAAGAALVRAPTVEAALQGSEVLAQRLAGYQREGLLQSFRGVNGLLPSELEQRVRWQAFEELPRTEVVGWLRDAGSRHGFAPRAFDELASAWLQPQREILRLEDAVLDPLRPLLERYVRVRGGVATVATYLEPAPGHSLAVIAERLQQDSTDTDVRVASRGLLQEELGRTLRRELIGFFTLSFLLNLVLIWWTFPRLRVAAAILVPQGLVIAACFTVMRLSAVAIDPVNLIIVPLIIGIGVDYCVYVAARWQQGEDWHASLSYGGRALAVSAFSTMASFGFLGLSEFPALARMGVFMALSLLLCWVCSFTLLPALIPDHRWLAARHPSDGDAGSEPETSPDGR